METLVRVVGNLFELAGILVIVAGAVRAALRFARRRAFEGLRSDLAQGVILGLELLVAADIVRTVAHRPDLESVLVLAMVVLIRTFLSVSIQMEIEGRWPWRRAEHSSQVRRD